MSWPAGKETGESGEAVLLFAPATHTASSSSCCKDKPHGPSSSSIGGMPAYFATDEERVLQCIDEKGEEDDVMMSQPKTPQCQRCRQPMLLVAQINAPVDCKGLDRTLYVFGCNRAECWRETTKCEATANGEGSAASASNRFIVGGGGVVRCFRSQKNCTTKTANTTEDAGTATAAASAPSMAVDDSSGWGVVGGDNDDASLENDWGADDGWGETSKPSDEDDMGDLEAMLEACEMKEQSKTKDSRNKKRSNKSNGKDGKTRAQAQANDMVLGQFPRFALDIYDEPYPHGGSATYHEGDGDDDDEAIGTTGAGASDDDIQKMLSRYLKDEEDQDIVQALGGVAAANTTSATTGSSGGGGEKYERLPPEERAFLAFTDRIKRSPEQVLRYAYGGVPMWSVPIHDDKGRQKQRAAGRHTQKGGSEHSFPRVQSCACGRERIFELEVLPSVLFSLNVDMHAQTHPQPTSNGSKTTKEDGMEQKMNNGGMDWGALVVYSCPDSCDMSREEFVVAQSSVDGTPTRREFTSIAAAEGVAEEED